MILFLALKNLFRNFRRTIALLFTIALGTGALFSFDGFIHGVLNELQYNTIHANYGHGQVFTKDYRGVVHADPIAHWIADAAQVQAFLSQLEGVQVFPRVSFSALLTNGRASVAGMGQGILAEREANFFHSLNVEEGEPLSTQQQGILLGKGLAHALNAKPGDAVIVRATSAKGAMKQGEFVVTGIFHTGSVDFDGRMFRIQLSAAQQLLNSDKIELFSLGLQESGDWNAVSEQLKTAYPMLEALPFDELDKIYYKNSVDWLNAQYNIVQVIILAIVLLGVFNSVSASILERKQEIGNLRANGESVGDVMQLVLAEGCLLALIGSLIGIAGAYTLLMLFVNKGLLMPPGPGQTRQFLVTFSFEWRMVLYALCISSLSALAASFFAGIKAAKMPIARALKSH
jgi:putative ABC transport system permease protein